MEGDPVYFGKTGNLRVR